MNITTEEMKEIRERLGEKVHELWMQKRALEKGWHDPKNCPKVSDIERIHQAHIEKHAGEVGKATVALVKGEPHCPNCHPCMVPYKDLPDSEKVLDRQYPMVFFQILEEIGYTVQKRPEPEGEQKSVLTKREVVLKFKKNYSGTPNVLSELKERTDELTLQISLQRWTSGKYLVHLEPHTPSMNIDFGGKYSVFYDTKKEAEEIYEAVVQKLLCGHFTCIAWDYQVILDWPEKPKSTLDDSNCLVAYTGEPSNDELRMEGYLSGLKDCLSAHQTSLKSMEFQFDHTLERTPVPNEQQRYEILILVYRMFAIRKEINRLDGEIYKLEQADMNTERGS